MDKVIIDKVDVSGCNNIDEWEHCNICQVLIKTVPNRHQCLTEGDLRCEFYPDCYYKQLKRLQAEYNDLHLNYAGCKTANTGLQELNEKLQAENEQLKKLKFKSDGIELLQDANLNLHNANVKYRQALQEIREIAVNEYYAVDDDARYITDKILAKINEVIGAEE